MKHNKKIQILLISANSKIPPNMIYYYFNLNPKTQLL